MTAHVSLLAAALVLTVSTDIAMGQNPTTIGGFMDGNALLEVRKDPTETARCQGYVMGVADAVSVVQSLGDTIHDWCVCIPKRAALSQMTGTGVAYLRAHSDLHHRAAAALAARSLAQSFRCR
jgi:hypothetical protein